MTHLDFEQLMKFRITNILLVCSSYDQFTIEEDGRIEMQIQSDYAELSLTQAPRFTRIDSGAEALKLIDSGASFDLVIVMFNIGEISPFDFSKLFKERHKEIPLVLLTSFSHEVSRKLSHEDTSHIDYVFSWQGNAELILAIIKMLEDKANAPFDIVEFGVQGILLVEDNVRFYSAYLPDLYKLIITQTNTSSLEALNEHQRKVRKRARPKILFARTLNEAKTLYNQYGNNLLGVISDISFPRTEIRGEVEGSLGIELCNYILKSQKKMPLLLQSSEESMAIEAQRLGADFICKGSKTLLIEIEEFIKTRLTFGPFSFTDPKDNSTVLAVAADLGGLQRAVETLPDDILLHYSARNTYSKWLYARGLFGLANSIKEKFVEDFNGVEELRNYLSGVIKSYRRTMGQGVIAEFSKMTYNEYITFARCGSGSLGGKARGLAFVGSLIEQYDLYTKWEGVRVTIPRTLAISSGYFEEFMQSNGLDYILTESNNLDDSDILNEFIGSRLPEELIDELRIFLSKVHRPLAIRSSSKLEDSHHQPFAGIYSTYMVPRSEDSGVDLRLVSNTIKTVYASIFFSASRAYIKSTSNVVGEESMGVVIQELCGTEEQGLYFPTLAGVARSVNYYPIGDEKPQEGICDITLGLGKAVVEGASRLRFSPAHPKHSLQLSTMETLLKGAQRHFYALNLNTALFKTSTDESINLEKIEVANAKEFRNLRHVASTWDIQNNRISDSYNGKGRPVISFASILKYSTFPLAEIIGELLQIGEREMNSPVEIEFAVNMDVESGAPSIFNFLQIRPMVSIDRGESLDWDGVNREGEIIYSEKSLGIGAIEGVRHFVYVRSENFDAAKSVEIAAEIERINSDLNEQNEGYVLCGPGRWGSSDHWLGIPVKWAQISGSKVIIECALPNYQIDPSQGTHFFQNLTSLGVGYLTISPFNGDGTFDTSRLDSMEAIYESEMVRVVRFDNPLYIFIDGKNSKAIIKEA